MKILDYMVHQSINVGLGDYWDYKNNRDGFFIIVMLMLVPYNRDVDFFQVHNVIMNH